jgi:hypothetical protein
MIICLFKRKIGYFEAPKQIAMKHIVYQVLFLTVMGIACSAQESQSLFMPVEFKKAYEKGTRKMNGTVSPTYWQNHSVYKIRASVDPYKKLLTGSAQITYYNNSPDTIRRPTFHAYHDYYKANSKRAGFFSAGSFPETDGMVIEQIEADGKVYDLKDNNQVVHNGTNYILTVNKGVPPGGQIQLSINWHYTIPGEGFERSGAIDSTSMFIAYWYPEMSVLDDIDGWDRIIYDAATEFYHDYSDYSVEITAPDNFTLWASVAPDNPTEVYQAGTLEKLAKAKNSTEGVAIISAAELPQKSSGKTLTWKYTAKNFPDFSFGLSDHFLWDAGVYKDKYGEYLINSAYPPDHKAFASVLKTIGGALKIFHTEFPAYPFPFKHYTIFNGLRGGGMEFPGMANDESYSGEDFSQWTGKKVSDYEANLGLSVHEMCHMYFPFIMGINEKKYAWMDEGMATFSGNFVPFDFPQNEGDNPYLGSQRVVPVMVPSYLYEGSGINSYTIGAFSYSALYKLLGKDLFLKCLNVYIDTWKFKHPTPYDFMFTINRVSGMDLNWFWKKWYFDWGYIDLGIKSFSNNTLTVENTGGRPMPFTIKVSYADGTGEEANISPAVWKSSPLYKHTLKTAKKVSSIQISIPKGADVLASNNSWKAK